MIAEVVHFHVHAYSYISIPIFLSIRMRLFFECNLKTNEAAPD